MPNEPTLKRSNVFISYGRAESKDFASRLYKRLKHEGMEVWFDQLDIPLAIDFQEQINEGISKAENFIFIIAPHSLRSPYCLKEIKLAVQQNKRIIPILHIEPTDRAIWEMMHPTISKLNWIYFREKYEAGKPLEEFEAIDSFESGISSLLALLSMHKAYVEQHTNILINAIEWLKSRKSESALLVDDARRSAEKWLLTTFDNTLPPCLPSKLHADYICASKKYANNMATQVYCCSAEESIAVEQKIGDELMFKCITAWNKDTDIKSGTKLRQAISEAIEQADNIIYFISPESVSNNNILWQLDLAMEYRKRIIPVLATPTPPNDIPPRIKVQHIIDCTTTDPEVFHERMIELFKLLHDDGQYHKQHKIYLCQAIKWKNQKQNQSILLRGRSLQNAKTWLNMSKTKNYAPTQLQEEYIATSLNLIGQIQSEVFICYSSANRDFALRLNNELQLNGKATWFEEETINFNPDYELEVFKGIEESFNFVFILSPQSVLQPNCSTEIAYAQKLNKRIIVLLMQETPKALWPEAFVKIAPIDFVNFAFDTSYSELLRTLEIDREYIHEHTKWTTEANDWNDACLTGADSQPLLLRGSRFVIAQEWLNKAIADKKIPEPPRLLIDYIRESRIAIEEAELEEQERKEELLKLQKERTDAIQHQLEAELKARSRQRIFLVILTLLLIASVATAVMAWRLKQEAEALKISAVEQMDIAQKKTELAQRNEEVANERLAQLEQERMKATASQNQANQFLKDIQRIEKEKEDAEKQLKELHDMGNSREMSAKEKLALAKRIAQQKSKLLTAYARQAMNKDYRLSFWLAEKAYRIDETNESAKSVYLKSYYQMFEPQYTVIKHNAEISSANFSSDKTMIVTSSWDKTIKLSDRNGKTVETLTGHTGVINYAEYSPNNKYVVSAGQDNTVRLWKISGKERETFNIHQGSVVTASFSRDGKNIVTAGKDGMVYIIDLKGNIIQELKHPKPLNSAFFSPDGKSIITVTEDNYIRIISTDGSEWKVFNRQTEVVCSAFFSPDGKYIITGSWDKTIRIYDLSKELIALFKEHQGKIASVAISRDGNTLISAGYDEFAYIMPLDIATLSESFASKTMNWQPSASVRAEYGLE